MNTSLSWNTFTAIFSFESSWTTALKRQPEAYSLMYVLKRRNRLTKKGKLCTEFWLQLSWMIFLIFYTCINPLRSGVGPIGPPIFQWPTALKPVVLKIWKKYLFLTSCMGYVFAVIMYLRKRHFMLLFQRFSDLSKKSRSILTLPTDTVSPCHSYASVPYHPALEFWDLHFRAEEAESRNSKEKASITHIEYPQSYAKYRNFSKQYR